MPLGDACGPVAGRLQTFELRGGGDEEAAASGMLQKVPAVRLVILPAASHIGISAETAVLVPMVSAFLDDVPPATPDLLGFAGTAGAKSSACGGPISRRQDRQDNVVPRQPLHHVLDHPVVDRGNRSGVPGPSWLIDGALMVPDDAATDIGHAVGGRAGLDQ
jgi:hypothetical protein